ncbi:hypothetical protein [Providencia alcalifaciens]|uniref:hypothetical protein n=1 Tax=Providencia alcalifaciens TaxID=126385 RepID=UPI00044CD3E1|nr:hypothetical protein [Providencia alcalifaciens]ETT04988.1 hypothetical protein HMPREF1562_0285 [Providencia alcalifaciens F90-2004]MTB33039.1 hypothetical protein [Providencia alcalifaciens]MTB33930.1 hypothetical protein [Providencia alcalifaciens]MTB33942.1 hypothetical protein [Providencia alcalifaciens]MTB34620.1 hypothetical protein [Providencia alcalifaciens]
MPHTKASVDINLKLILSDEALPKVKGMYEISAPEDAPNIQILLNEFVKNLIGEDVIKTALKKAALKALVSDILH